MNSLPDPDARRVIAYVCTSSSEEGDASGLERQRRSIRAYAQAEGLSVVASVREDVAGTAKADERPGLQEAMAAALQHGAGALIVAERSRLAGDEDAAYDTIRAVQGFGLRLLYAEGDNGTDDTAQLTSGIARVIAAHDRRRIVARLKAGRDAKAAVAPASRAQGGRLPHGYRRGHGGTVEIDPQAAAEICRAFDLVRGGLSIAMAAAELTEETGHAWSATALGRMLHREIYKLAEPGRIIDPRVWRKTQTALASRRKVKSA
jgi:DNA invertase Pin-like site-specific DNA recombinase